MTKTAKEILEEAGRIVHEDRRAAYGHPRDNFTNIGKLWSVVFGHEVTPEQVSLCMILVKVAREIHKESDDNMTDVIGYSLTKQMLKEVDYAKGGVIPLEKLKKLAFNKGIYISDDKMFINDNFKENDSMSNSDISFDDKLNRLKILKEAGQKLTRDEDAWLNSYD